MNKAIVRLRKGVKDSGYTSLSDKLRNHYTLEVNVGFIKLPVDAAKRLESDPRVIVEYPDGTTSDSKTKKTIKKEKKTKKLTKTAIRDMSEEEQVILLKKLGSTIIPKKENGRIQVILQLQENQEKQ